MQILIPGHMDDSGSGRVKATRQHMGHLPAMRCTNAWGRTWYVCGDCFGRKGRAPFTNQFEMWIPGTDRAGNFHYEVVPLDAICEDCGGHAWPAD